MKTYTAKKGGLIHAIFIGLIILPIVVFVVNTQSFIAQPYMLLPLIVPLFILLWVYTDTLYSIDKGTFKYHSAFLKGEIEISKIREVVKGKTRYVGVKPAMAKGGIIIRYEKFGEIYIAPEDNDLLIADLLAINREIKITG